MRDLVFWVGMEAVFIVILMRELCRLSRWTEDQLAARDERIERLEAEIRRRKVTEDTPTPGNLGNFGHLGA